MNNEILNLFHTSKIKSILTYASPARFYYISRENVIVLGVQKTALKIILPKCSSYEQWLSILNLMTIEENIFNFTRYHFNKILPNPEHPWHQRLSFNNNRHSGRLKCPFYIKKKTVQKDVGKVFFSIL